MGGKRVNMARTACLVLCLAALPALVAAQEGEEANQGVVDGP